MRRNKRTTAPKWSSPLPPNNPPIIRPQQQQIFGVIEQTVSWHFPLPPPPVLIEYNKAIPTAGDRLIVVFEKQANHSHQIEIMEQKRKDRGQRFAFSIVSVSLLCSFVLIALDKSIQGISTLIISLGAISGLFVYGKHIEIKEQTQKK